MNKPFLRLAYYRVSDTSGCSEFRADFPMRIRWQRSRVHTNGRHGQSNASMEYWNGGYMKNKSSLMVRPT